MSNSSKVNAVLVPEIADYSTAVKQNIETMEKKVDSDEENNEGYFVKDLTKIKTFQRLLTVDIVVLIFGFFFCIQKNIQLGSILIFLGLFLCFLGLYAVWRLSGVIIISQRLIVLGWYASLMLLITGILSIFI